MLGLLDEVLVNIIKFLERLHATLGRMGDYVLELISRSFEAVLRVVRRAISIVYRFLRDLIINLTKIGWNIFQLALIPLFFGFLWSFGNELRYGTHWLVGLLLEVLGMIGFAFFGIAFLASLAKPDKSEPEQPVTGGASSIKFGFFLLDALSLIGLLIITFAWFHWFKSPLLRVSQIAECRALSAVASILDNEGAAEFARKSKDFAGPPPKTAGTEVPWPKATKWMEPDMPQAALRKEALGVIELDVLVGKDGKVLSVQVTKSIPAIDDAVVSAFKKKEYQPSFVEGAPVLVTVPETYLWAGIPMPADLRSQLSGSASFEGPTEVVGKISNPTAWAIAYVTADFSGPKDSSVPRKWERSCGVNILISPNMSLDFRCQVEKVEGPDDFNWSIKNAWGVPPPKD